MSDSPHRKGFEIVNAKEKTFTLYDKVFGRKRVWKLSDDVPAGYSFLSDQLDKEGLWIRKQLPKDFYKLDKKERERILNEKIDQMPEAEQMEYLNRMKRNSDKQLALICSFVEPMHEIPEIWNEKIEHLAACLSDQSDVHQINDFFLKNLNGTTTLPEATDPKKKGK